MVLLIGMSDCSIQCDAIQETNFPFAVLVMLVVLVRMCKQELLQKKQRERMKKGQKGGGDSVELAIRPLSDIGALPTSALSGGQSSTSKPTGRHAKTTEGQDDDATSPEESDNSEGDSEEDERDSKEMEGGSEDTERDFSEDEDQEAKKEEVAFLSLFLSLSLSLSLSFSLSLSLVCGVWVRGLGRFRVLTVCSIFNGSFLSF